MSSESKPGQARFARTPETKQTPEVAFDEKIVKIYNAMLGCSREEQLKLLRTELGTNAQIVNNADRGVIFIRPNQKTDWAIIPELGEDTFDSLVGRWFWMPEISPAESAIQQTFTARYRKILDYKLDRAGFFPKKYKEIPYIELITKSIDEYKGSMSRNETRR